jgi:hypothetical protein
MAWTATPRQRARGRPSFTEDRAPTSPRVDPPTPKRDARDRRACGAHQSSLDGVTAWRPGRALQLDADGAV